MKLILLGAFASLVSSTAAKHDVENIQQPLSHTSIEDHKLDPLLSLHQDLVEIESTTGNEYNVGKYLVSYLTSHNFTVETQSVPFNNTSSTASDPLPTNHERFDVLAYRGTNRTTRTLVTSHIDTVPPYYPYKSHFDGHYRQLWGRGSVDAKGSVAPQIRAVINLFSYNELKESDVALLFVVGEETGGDGMRAVNALNMTWETVIFGEPTELKLVSGHKGNLGFSLTAHGKAGHSGYPELFVNANSLLIPVLSALENMHMPSSEKYGKSTLNIGYMQGGVAGNVIPGKATANVQIRIAAGTAQDMRKRVVDLVQGVSGGKVEVEFPSEGYGCVDIDADVEGFDVMTVNYGTDIPNLEGKHKRYLFGPGSIFRAHSDHEHLTATDLNMAVDGYQVLIMNSLGNK
ncbi:MAG: hypothetical protein M1812_006505 [Candelaria pacifica]|nr:MAG: hypothetical protein M1812_006505 [Candelaria pacifica]